MKNIIFAVVLSLTVITTAHGFSNEVLLIIQRHWSEGSVIVVKLDEYVCDHMTDGVCYLLDQLFEELIQTGRPFRLIGPCKPYPIPGNVAYHRSD